MVNLLSFNSLSLSEYSGTAIGLLSWVGLGVVSIRCLLASTAELTPAPVLCARPRVSIRCLLASTAERQRRHANDATPAVKAAAAFQFAVS